jgi:hypothetical protein
MSIPTGQIFNGYLRLYCAINELPMIPKRCIRCGGELDSKYKARHSGNVCLSCYVKRKRELRHLKK